MKVVCPECSTFFDVPHNLLGTDGKRVRCHRCGHVWHQPPFEAEETDVFDISEPAAQPPVSSDIMTDDEIPAAFGGFRALDDGDVDPIPASVHPDTDEDDPEDGEIRNGFFKSLDYRYLGRMMVGFVLGLSVFAAALAGAAKSGLTHPVFSPFYQMAGLEIETGGLEIKDVKLENAGSGNDGKIIVTGWVVNNTGSDQSIPAIEITPIDSTNHEAAALRVTPDQDTAKPGEGVEFRAEISANTLGGGRISVEFAH